MWYTIYIPNTYYKLGRLPSIIAGSYRFEHAPICIHYCVLFAMVRVFDWGSAWLRWQLVMYGCSVCAFEITSDCHALDLHSGGSQFEYSARTKTSLTEVSLVFLSPSRQIMGYYLKYSKTATFQIFSTWILSFHFFHGYTVCQYSQICYYPTNGLFIEIICLLKTH